LYQKIFVPLHPDLKAMKILFVCHGNICRSVMAEMIMKQMLREKGREGVVVDSCATSREEIGNDIYPPAKTCLSRHNIRSEEHCARQITLQDINESDLVFVMDRNNIRNLERMFGEEVAGQEKIKMLMEVCGYHREVADPWYTGDFEVTYRDVVMGCEAIMKMV